jgi:hypothetical protein
MLASAHKHANLTLKTFNCMSPVLHPKPNQEHVQTTESTQYPSCILDLSTFRGALLLFCYPLRCWHHVVLILSVLEQVTLATPYGDPGCLPLSCRKLGLWVQP